MADNTQTIFDQAESFIKQGQNYATTAIDQALNDISVAISQANNTQFIALQPDPSSSIVFQHDITKPYNLTNIPQINAALSQNYLDEFKNQFAYIMSNYFKDLYSFNLGEKALENILNNGYTIKLNIHNQIVSRSLDNEMVKAKSLINDATLDFISKGWNIPNSFLQNRIDRINQDYSNNVSQVIREVAIKEEDLNNEMYKFAIQVSMDLLPKCIEVANNFSGRVTQMFSLGADSAKAYIQGLSVVDQSIRSYESELLQRTQLGISESNLWRDYDLKAKDTKAKFDLSKVELGVRTTISGVSALTQIGTAGLTAQQSIVNLTSAGVTTINSGTTV